MEPKPKVILASQSPRRRELLAQMGVEFEAIPSDFDEKLDDSRPPEEVAAELAVGKAMTVARSYPGCIVIGSDTIVTLAGKQLEKPHDMAEATSMLKQLSGHENDVSTGLAVLWLEQNIRLIGADTTKVFFKPYDEQAVKQYVETGDPLDKAGAYGIQSGAAPLISHIEGQYDTVVGLPTLLLAEYLTQVGIAARPVELTSPVKQI
ncbi:MAG TPA: Maf family protein [Candidatus Limnocylindrales bacterium]|nr:Maf family protein [Candidatus Limnocylindrales bacterium]